MIIAIWFFFPKSSVIYVYLVIVYINFVFI